MTKYLLILFVCGLQFAVAQKPFSKVLDKREEAVIFTDAQKQALGIEFSIYRTYAYTDHSGDYYFVMTENSYKETEKDSFNDAIRGYCIKRDGHQLSLEWKLRDFKNTTADYLVEESIWFFSKYSRFEDIDGDGLIEPIIIYGTMGGNGLSDGRIKILTYYKGAKRAIRHQNGISDYDRNTQVDQAFYELPASVQGKVRRLMTMMEANLGIIFPAGWEAAMDNKKVFFDEN